MYPAVYTDDLYFLGVGFHQGFHRQSILWFRRLFAQTVFRG